MKKITFLLVFLLGITFAITTIAQQTSSAPQTSASTQTKPAKIVDQKTKDLVRRMSDLLANAKTFTFRTKEEHDRVRLSGKKVKVQITREVAVRRPDGLWMHIVSQAPDKSRELGIWYDGKALTLQSDKEKVYAHTKMPPTLDEAFDYAGSTLDLPTPMADVLYSSPYDAFIVPDSSGKYVKIDKIEGKACHQLAFQNPGLDYRLWIADGEQPLLCQVEITYKRDPQIPVIRMTFLDWNLSAQIAADRFNHVPPADFRKIKIIGRVPMEENPQTQTSPQTQEN